MAEMFDRMAVPRCAKLTLSCLLSVCALPEWVYTFQLQPSCPQNARTHTHTHIHTHTHKIHTHKCRNTASRMESTCRYGCIQISEATHKLLPDHPFTPTGVCMFVCVSVCMCKCVYVTCMVTYQQPLLAIRLYIWWWVVLFHMFVHMRQALLVSYTPLCGQNHGCKLTHTYTHSHSHTHTHTHTRTHRGCGG
jgi:hypothetical protein